MNNRSDYKQTWCCHMRWPDTNRQTFKPFLFGTVFAENELAAERALRAAWSEICPHSPDFVAIIPGALIFCPPEADQQATP